MDIILQLPFSSKDKRKRNFQKLKQNENNPIWTEKKVRMLIKKEYSSSTSEFQVLLPRIQGFAPDLWFNPCSQYTSSS